MKIPDGLILAKLDDILYSQLINHLCLVLRPQLSQADNAFSPSQPPQSPPVVLVIVMKLKIKHITSMYFNSRIKKFEPSFYESLLSYFKATDLV